MKRSIKNVLVTGGAGFIGSHLVDALISKGYSVRVLDNLLDQIHPGGSLPVYFNRKSEFIKGDVTDKTIWPMVLKDIEAVFHFASAVGVGQSMYEIDHYVNTNCRGTALMLDFLANNKTQVRKMIVAGSMSSYGEGSYYCGKCGKVRPSLRLEANLKARDFTVYCPICDGEASPIATKEEEAQNSNSIYSITKKTQEEMVINIGKAYGIPAVSLRFFNVYGSRQSLSNPYNGVAAIFLSRIKNGKKPIINEDGTQTRDFIHVSDVVKINLAALENDAANYQAFNVGYGIGIPIVKVAQILSELLNANINPEITYKSRKLDVKHCFADISKAKKLLGWTPQTNLKSGLHEVIEWGSNQNAIDIFDKSLKEMESRGLR